MKRQNFLPLKRLLFFILAGFLSLPVRAGTLTMNNEPDTAYIFAYTTAQNSNKNGLHFAWSTDKENWHAIGPEHSYIKSDYGRWGKEKRMIDPFLFRDNTGMWHCVWSLNEYDSVLAHASSEDLVYWGRQSYHAVSENGNCLSPQLAIERETGHYIVSWLSGNEGNEENEGDMKAYRAITADLKKIGQAKQIAVSDFNNVRTRITVLGQTVTGTIHKVSWDIIDGLIQKQKTAAFNALHWSETSAGDNAPISTPEPLDVAITVKSAKGKKISDMLIGVFFEDINYAADGGLYAELVQNRGFEYTPNDKEGHDPGWNSTKAWKLNGMNASLSIDSVNPVHPNNPHYAVLSFDAVGAGLVNEGFDGIPVKAGEKYDFSLFARVPEGKGGKLIIRLTGKDGEIYGETMTKNISGDWKKYETVLTAKATVSDARLEVIPQVTGKVELDMISLFPQNTFNKRKNGLRADLAQSIADLNPRFVRFPGGCVAHGDGLENMYRWKNTIGPPEARKPQRNIWGYHQTAGLGYFEYFQFCEDIGAEPVPIVPAGVPCQNSATGGAGQQGGIPLDEMDEYIQEIIDLIEWANGDKNTTWGKKRAQAGHPEPFNLKYLGVGNEDLITDIFEERFTLIYNAIKEKHPEITVIGTVGPFCEGTDYVEGWDLATKLRVPMVDEHYYQSPGWFIHNQDFYDRYDRSKSKVYLGEYAAHLPGRPNNIETALAEALYLTSVERNGDVVEMTSYAPLFAKEGHINWNPDLIYFNNTEVKPTVGYFVQKMYGLNSGDEYLPGEIKVSTKNEKISKRVAASIVRDNKSGDIIVKLVNILPVEANMNIDLTALNISGSTAIKTVLSGKPDDRSATPQHDEITIAGNTNLRVPPYSFTVIRIRAKN